MTMKDVCGIYEMPAYLLIRFRIWGFGGKRVAERGPRLSRKTGSCVAPSAASIIRHSYRLDKTFKAQRMYIRSCSARSDFRTRIANESGLSPSSRSATQAKWRDSFATDFSTALFLFALASE
jgi:hypothetical protein